MGIFLSQDNLLKIVQLPVMPEKINIDNGSQNEVIDLVNLGQGNFLSGKPLKSISLNSWFPLIGELTGLTNFEIVESPDFYINLIEEFQYNGKPTRLTITEVNISQLVSIEDFNYEIDDDYSYDLSFNEFRQVLIAEVADIEVRLNPPEEQVEEVAPIVTDDRPNDEPVPIEVTVVPGDSLWKIAKKNLGSGRRYPEIASLNDIKAPYIIQPGDILLLPAT